MVRWEYAYNQGGWRTMERDGKGNILKKVHPNAYEEKTKNEEGICYDYDGENRLLRINYLDGGVEKLFYDAAGNRISEE